MFSTGTESTAVEPVAVIGLSCRLPGADDPEQFWRLLVAGVDAVTEVPAGRWPDAERTEFRRGGFLTNVDGFDAAFFGISPKEAAAMDPQQRLMLELSWEALENARIAPTGLRGTPTGVFVGAIAGDYALLHDRLGAESPDPHTLTGVQRSLIANRVSYLLGLRGPSLTLDTGQSSSLAAVQLACEHLRRGTARVALAGGVNLNLLAETSAVIGGFGALSPDGRCHTFDSRANGYVRGEGGALLVLKPLSAALADGDQVHSVILGGAVNNDGGGDGLTVPSGRAQEEVIRLACRQAGVSPGDVRYVELHGTGTRVGDPIEAAALGAALGTARPAGDPLLVGSVKTNIGHLEGAAGVAGLLKVILSIRDRRLAPSLNFVTPNPDIPLATLNLDVVRTARAWPAPEDRLVAGVSSFGVGGTNCHLVLAEAPRQHIERTTAPEISAPLVLSARSAPALRAQAGALSAHLTEHEDTEIADVALSLVRTRAHFEHRAVVLGADRAELLAGLDGLAGGLPATGVVTGRTVPGGTAFVFPGQGSQWPDMARALLEDSPVFAARLHECARALAPYTDYSVLDVLRGAPDAPDLLRVDVVQSALWAVMVSLAEVWRDHGVEPSVVMGTSQGEIAAATAIGALTVDDAARVVALRGRVVRRLVGGGGGLMSVGAPAEVVTEFLATAPEVSIGAVNGPRSVVLTGPVVALTALKAALTEAGHRTKILVADYASHSPAVDVLRDELLSALAPIRPVTTSATFISTVTGQPLDSSELTAEYWFANLRRPVLFADAGRYAMAHGFSRFVECNPHPVLATSIEEIAEEAGRDVVVVGTLRRDDGGLDRVARSIAEAYAGGASVDWDGLPGARLTDLPTYRFQRERHWLRGTAHRPAAQVSEQVPAGHREQAPQGTSRRELRELVTGAAAAILGHRDASAVDPSSTFKDLGFDSVSSVELRNQLQAMTGLRLSTTLLFDFPTPDAVVGTLHTRLGGTPTETAPVKDTRPVDEPIAIVAMGCRYPGGVASPEDLWRLVATGTDAISALPTNRGWDLDAMFGPGDGQPGTCATRFGGFLHDADTFDAAFFGLSPREALAMDPQQRLLLETSWDAVERAGLTPDDLTGTATGVFVGAMAMDYGPRLHQPTGVVDGHLLTGTTPSVASGRIAYTFGLNGPAITIDTACSSSLVAIKLAVESLRRGECTLALAGGATLMSNPGNLVEFSRQNGLATDGRAKAFSSAADGTAFAEGAGMLLLARLSDAQRDGLPVLAVIRGIAANSDGASNGLSAPNGLAQQQVIRRALDDAGLAHTDIDAVEAHGTGTALGDPIEAGAILATYGQDRPADEPVWLGSVKSNIGHTQAAAGVAGVIKMVQAMRHGTLPPTLHAEQPTTKVDWDAGQVRVLTEGRPWPESGRPRRSAVSSFGISGTNAHIVLEATSAPEAAQSPDEPLVRMLTERQPWPESGQSPDEPLVWVLSARSAASLRANASRLRTFAESAADADLAAAGAVLARRATFAHRAVVRAADRDELCAALAAIADGGTHPAAHTGTAGRDTRPVFVFPGQGAQWVGMAVGLLENDPTFATHLRRCAEALAPHTGWSVLDVLTGADGAPGLESTEVVQPVLFALNVALARLWQSVGVEPAAVVGHSQGEVAAAHIAGALSLDDAAKVVTARSQLVASALDGTGGVLAVGLPAAQVRDRVAAWPGKLWVAVDNGPSGTVIAGDLTAIEEFVAACDETVPLRRTPVAYAAHTPHIEAVRTALLARLDGLTPADTDTAICSSRAGDFIAGSELTGEYWYGNLADQVRFDAAIRAFHAYPGPLFVEVSPHPILAGAVGDILADAGIDGHAVGTLRRGEGGRDQFVTALAAAFVRGAAVNWTAVLGPVRRHVDLPTYAFDRQRYWLGGAERGGSVATLAHPLLDAVVPVAGDGGVLLTGKLSRNTVPWVVDHAVRGTVLLPGTAFVELALEAATAVGADLVEDLTLHAPLVLPATGAAQVQVTVGGADEHGQSTLVIHSRPAADPDADWTRHVSGALTRRTTQPADVLGEWPPAAATPVDLSGCYDRLAEIGYEYGPAFQGLTAAWRHGDDRYAEVILPEPAGDAAEFTIHPALLDAALHVLVLDGDGSLSLPFSWSGVWLGSRGANRVRVRLTGQPDTGVSIAIFDTTGALVGGVEELTMRPAPTGMSFAAPSAEPYHVDWVATPVPAASPRPDLVVVGNSPAAKELCTALGLPAPLADLTEVPEPAPPVVVVPCPPEDADPRRATRTVLREVLDLLREWLAQDRFAGSRLVFLADHESLTGAPVWGLVRSAITEHPDRFGLADATEEDVEPLRAALATAEPQFAVRAGQVVVPRVVRRAAGQEPTVALGDGTVLVTGGTTGLGALAAVRLVERHGVRDLLLTSRRGAEAPGVTELVGRLTGLGASVRVAACDVADRTGLASLLAGENLVGVVHAAGMLDDAVIVGLSPERLDTVLAPKLDGAWLLHELTAGHQLRAFVLFSSVAGVLGNPGQGNYAAANAFLDTLATYRRTQGLPAVSVAWGLWSTETGMTSGMSAADTARLSRTGVAPLAVQHGLDLFDAALREDADAHMVAARWDRAALRARVDAGEPIPAVLGGLVGAARRPAGETVTRTDTLPDRIARLSRAEATALVTGIVRNQVAIALGHRAPDAIDTDKPFSELGLDSLTSVEMRNRLSTETGLRLPASLVFNHPTVTILAEYLVGALTPTAKPAEQLLREALAEILPSLADTDRAGREQVVATLRAALDSLDAADVPGDDMADALELASDDEIFAFIDTQL